MANGKLFVRDLVSGLASVTSCLTLNPPFQFTFCSSSLRYKTNIKPYGGGLSVVAKLQPITFNWKKGGTPDFGLGAEDVAKAEPLLVTHNEKGEIEGVKYDRVVVVLLNAVKEQQAQIEQEKAQIETLTKLVCGLRPKADACRHK